jgi:hypothetical protein
MHFAGLAWLHLLFYFYSCRDMIRLCFPLEMCLFSRFLQVHAGIKHSRLPDEEFHMAGMISVFQHLLLFRKLFD